MKAKDTVAEIMTKQVVTLCINDGLIKAETLFKKHRIHHLPVVEKQQIVGMLSWNDLLRISFADAVDNTGDMTENDMYGLFDVEKIMTSRVISIPANTSIKKAAKIFVKEKYHAMPVVDDDKMVGILTTTDIIKYYLKQ